MSQGKAGQNTHTPTQRQVNMGPGATDTRTPHTTRCTAHTTRQTKALVPWTPMPGHYTLHNMSHMANKSPSAMDGSTPHTQATHTQATHTLDGD